MNCPRCQAPVDDGSHFCTGCGLPISASRAPTAVDPLIGRVLNNRFRILSKLGEGGFGAVYRGEQLQMDRPVALKVLHRHMAQDPQLVQRFQREAKSACNLRDPHTIITYDFDQTDDGLLYIAMELLNGRSLFETLRNDGPMPGARVAYLIDQVCSSLDEAHRQGIVHRDIKPENIYVEEREGNPDFVKVLDFGIAKIVRGDANQQALTAAGETIGTLEYMPPEQLKGQQLDGRSDIYALGVMMYQMITGDLPFRGDTPASIITKHLMERPTPPSKYKPELNVAPAIEQVCLQMLEKDREKRYANVGALRQALTEAARTVGGARPGTQAGPSVGPAMGARPAGVPGTAIGVAAGPRTGMAAGPPSGPSTARYALIGGLAVLILVGGYFGLAAGIRIWPFSRPPPRPPVVAPHPPPVQPRPVQPRPVVRPTPPPPRPRPVVRPQPRPTQPPRPRPPTPNNGFAPSGALPGAPGGTALAETGPDILSLVPVQMGALLYLDLAALRADAAAAPLVQALAPVSAQVKKFGIDLAQVRRVVMAVPSEDTSIWEQAGMSAATGAGKKKSTTPDRLLLIVNGGFDPQRILGSLRNAMVKAGDRPVEQSAGAVKILRGRKNVAALLADRSTVVLSHRNPHELVLGAAAGQVPREGVPALLREVGLGRGVKKPVALVAMRTTPALRTRMTAPHFPDGANIEGLVLSASTGPRLWVSLDLQCRTPAQANQLEARLHALLAQARATPSGATASALGKALLERLAIRSRGAISRAELSLSSEELTTLTGLIRSAQKG